MAAVREEALKSKKPFDYDRPIEGLRALDKYTLQFKLEEPQPRFLHTLATGDLFGAVAREVVEAYADQTMSKPVGTGPFRLVEWRRSSKIVLEKNPTYRERFYDAEPNPDDAEGQALLHSLQRSAVADDRSCRDSHHRRTAATLAGVPEPAAGLSRTHR